MSLEPVETVIEKRTLSKLRAVMDNTSHPLCTVFSQKNSACSGTDSCWWAVQPRGSGTPLYHGPLDSIMLLWVGGGRAGNGEINVLIVYLCDSYFLILL